jgi:hypothetical protein
MADLAHMAAGMVRQVMLLDLMQQQTLAVAEVVAEIFAKMAAKVDLES